MQTFAGPGPAAERLRSPVFVGRRRERELLGGLVDRVYADRVPGPGGDCAAVVLGEPGVGKTALLEQVAPASPRALWVRGGQAESGLAYAAVADLLLPVRDHIEQLPPVQRDALHVALALGPGRRPNPLAVCAGTLGVLAAAGAAHPVLVVVDDYQWMDPASRQVLSFVARRLVAGRVGMLFGVRDGPGRQVPPPDLPALRLAGLSRGECRALVRELDAEVSPTALAEILEQTGGNPLAVLGRLAGPACAAATGLRGPSAGHSLERAWSDAVDELPDATGVALFVLAAAGPPEPRVAEVEAVLGALGCSLSDLEPAERSGLVATAPALTLRHPLLRPVVVDRTPLVTRLAVYRALAAHAEPHLRVWYRAAAATGPDDDVADGLAAAAAQARDRAGYGESARTWRRAAILSGDRDIRAERLLAAATDALVAGASELAVSWCDEALRLRRDPCFVADVELVRGRARTWLGRLPDAAADLVRAGDSVSGQDAARAARLYAEAAVPFAMANRQHDMLAVALRSEAVEPAGQRSRHSVATAAVALTLRGDGARARERLDVGSRPADPAGQVWDLQLDTVLARSLIWLEDFDGARRRLGTVLDRARRSGATWVLAPALAARSELDAWTGNWAAADDDAAEALHRADELHQTPTVGQALTALARLDAARGELARCAERLDRARRDAGAHGIDCLAVSIPAVRGLAALGVGESDEAAEHLDAAWAAAERGGLHGPDVVPFGGDLVEAHVQAGHGARAAQALGWLDERAAASDLAHPAAVAARCRGLLAEDLDVAVACFATARALHDRVEMPFERARTLLCEAETLRRMRRPAAARPLLREALGVFAGLGARPWAARAERELAATGVRPAVVGADPGVDGLTPQEFQIARAVAEGASNAEAAATLFVSRKTVEAHLTRVYRKLGLRSRSELARAFARVPPPAARSS